MKHYLVLWLGLAVALPFSAAANAADFPTKPITVIMPYAPGGLDTEIRLLSQTIEKELGQGLIIDNRPGAGGAVGVTAAKNARPDGHTLLAAGMAVFAVVPHMQGTSYSIDDFVPIARLTATPLVVAANPNAPFNSLPSLIAYAKANPGKVKVATGGAGTLMHLVAAALQVEAGVEFNFIHYQGLGAAVTATLAGETDFYIAAALPAAGHAKEGKLRFLASTGEKRSEFYPELPTIKELGFNVVEISTMAVFAPKDVPADTLKRLQDVFANGIKSGEYAAALAKVQTSVHYGNSQETRAQVVELNKLWGSLFKSGDALWASMRQ